MPDTPVIPATPEDIKNKAAAHVNATTHRVSFMTNQAHCTECGWAILIDPGTGEIIERGIVDADNNHIRPLGTS
jgi:hypothetical protein